MSSRFLLNINYLRINLTAQTHIVIQSEPNFFTSRDVHKGLRSSFNLLKIITNLGIVSFCHLLLPNGEIGNTAKTFPDLRSLVAQDRGLPSDFHLTTNAPLTMAVVGFFFVRTVTAVCKSQAWYGF